MQFVCSAYIDKLYTISSYIKLFLLVQFIDNLNLTFILKKYSKYQEIILIINVFIWLW